MKNILKIVLIFILSLALLIGCVHQPSGSEGQENENLVDEEEQEEEEETLDIEKEEDVKEVNGISIETLELIDKCIQKHLPSLMEDFMNGETTYTAEFNPEKVELTSRYSEDEETMYYVSEVKLYADNTGLPAGTYLTRIIIENGEARYAGDTIALESFLTSLQKILPQKKTLTEYVYPVFHAANYPDEGWLLTKAVNNENIYEREDMDAITASVPVTFFALVKNEESVSEVQENIKKSLDKIEGLQWSVYIGVADEIDPSTLEFMEEAMRSVFTTKDGVDIDALISEWENLEWDNIHTNGV